MSNAERRRHLLAGVAGGVLIVSLFLPWAEQNNASVTGWELWTMSDVFLLIVGIFGLLAAITGGRIGLFRPDLSLSAAADLLALVAATLLALLLTVDFPAAAGREIGPFVALVGSVAIAAGVGDYRPLKGAPWFPRLSQRDPS